MNMFPVVILCGGRATRLYPVTRAIPKALVDVRGEPFIHWQLALLRKNGVREVVICAGYLGRQIKAFVGDGSAWGLCVRYSFDGKKLRGTGGALKKAFPLLPDTFFVMYGDSYLTVNLRNVAAYFHRRRKDALMTVYRNNNAYDASNIVFRGGSIRVYDKVRRDPAMRHIDYGLSIVTKKAFALMGRRTVFDLADLYQLLVRDNRMLGFAVRRRFYEIGSFAGLAAARKELPVAGAEAGQ
jgi:NDP-sugar pyrophosphorylase family protein